MHGNVPVRFGRGRLDSLGHRGLAAYLIGCAFDVRDIGRGDRRAQYRVAAGNGQTRVDAWAESLAVSAELPTLSLWLGAGLCLPLPLDGSYTGACRSLRILR